MGWLGRLLQRRNFRVSLAKDHSALIYREGKRRVLILGENMADGFAVYASSIECWDGLNREPISDLERYRITSNIHTYYSQRGKNIYVS